MTLDTRIPSPTIADAGAAKIATEWVFLNTSNLYILLTSSYLPPHIEASTLLFHIAVNWYKHLQVEIVRLGIYNSSIQTRSADVNPTAAYQRDNNSNNNNINNNKQIYYYGYLRLRNVCSNLPHLTQYVSLFVLLHILIDMLFWLNNVKMQ